jgi:GAF domain-containing protein/ABC-type uncharacterized transport system substrate-binding protein
MKFIKRSAFAGLIFLMVFVTAFGFAVWAQDEEEAQVLVLHSYHQGYKWTDDITEGIESVLGDAQENVDLQIEYMDTKRIFDEEYIQGLYDLYKHKFSDSQFDVIISSDNNAFDFLLEYRDDLFPGTPVVFSGVNFFEDNKLDGYDLFTGVNEELAIRGGLDIALTLHPDVEQIVIVNDTTTTGRRVHERIMEVIPDYEDTIEFTLLEDVTMEEIREAVQQLPSDSLVFYTLFLRDSSGQFFEYDESISMIAEKSTVPIYGAWDFSLGYGIVGGLLTSGYFQGSTAAQLAQRILDGEEVQDIPVVKESPNRYMFDYEQVQRWEIPMSALPEDSIFVNKPVTFYERYRGWVLGGAGSIIGLVVIVVALGTANLRRRRAEEALQLSNTELEQVRESLEERVTERTAALEKRAVQLQAAIDISRITTSVLDPTDLLERSVSLVQERFGFYYVGLFLVDEDHRWAVLRASTGGSGKDATVPERRVEIGGNSAIGQCVAEGNPRVIQDVEKEGSYSEGLDPVSETRSKVALPLHSRGKVLGAMTVHSVEPSAFDSADIAVLQTLVDQVAVALANARLFAEAQDTLREMEAIHQRYLGEAWRVYARSRSSLGYERVGGDVKPIDQALPEAQQAMDEQGPVVAGASRDSFSLVVPIMLRGQAVGALGFEDPEGQRNWGPEEIATAKALAEQLALAADNLRLLEETQSRAIRERLTGEIAEQLRGSLDPDTILKTTVRELGRALGAERTSVEVSGPVRDDGTNGTAQRDE